jgi:hypothetical protein
VNVGDIVTCENNSTLKKGRIVSIQSHLGTVLVRWEDVKNTSNIKYHFPHHLKSA